MAAQLELDQTFFVELQQLISETYHLQNWWVNLSAPTNFVCTPFNIYIFINLYFLSLKWVCSPPDFNKVGRHVLSALEPYHVENGSVLHIKHIHYTEHCRCPPPPTLSADPGCMQKGSTCVLTGVLHTFSGNIIIQYPAMNPHLSLQAGVSLSLYVYLCDHSYITGLTHPQHDYVVAT
jgi:hypothetical protein